MGAYRGVIFTHYERSAITERTNEVMNRYKILANYLAGSGYLWDTSLETVNGEIAQLSNLYDGRILIIDSDYRIVKDSYGISESKTILSGKVIQCFNGNQSSNYDKVNQYIEMTIPISAVNSDDVIGVIVASASTDSIQNSVELLRRSSLLVEIALWAILTALAVFLSSELTKPLGALSRMISSVKEGFTGGSIPPAKYTELDATVDSLNQLLDRMKILDDSRQEFVSNVSHELKTPIASMKVLADSLLMQEDAPVEMYREFMQDITNEIDRENTVITDLLSLVKMDKTSADLNIKTVDIGLMLELILHRLRPIAEKNSVEVIYESMRPVEAEVDEVKLTLAFSNLIENAIKYNRKDGWVKVTLDADHQFFWLEVSDCGIGIPEESLNHIFERFYRVDKSHSREIGGTGLGLAITRSSVLMHRGSIKVDSVEGEGTTFTVRIPLSYIS